MTPARTRAADWSAGGADTTDRVVPATPLRRVRWEQGRPLASSNAAPARGRT